MSITLFIAEFAKNIIEKIGYLGVFILMTLESALIPIPSEIVMPFSGFLVAEGKMNFWLALLVGTLGNLTGSLIAYLLGYFIGIDPIKKAGKYLLIREEHLEKAEKLVEKYRIYASFIGRLLPAVRTIISLPLGMVKTELKPFLVLTFTGSLIWNIVLLYLGVILRENWIIIEHYGFYLDIIAVLVVVLLLVYVFRSRK